MLKQAVQTFLGVSLVHVITATMEMDSIVLTSMSVHNKMNVAKMLNVVTLLDHMNVNAAKALKEMEKSVII